MTTPKNQAALILRMSKILRGQWKQYEYQNVILPFVMLGRLHCLPNSSVDDPRASLRRNIKSLNPDLQDILNNFGFEDQLTRLNSNHVLRPLLKELDQTNLTPEHISNHDMGTIFEELIRQFSEQSSETAGEHYTPRDIIALASRLVFEPDLARLTSKNQIIDIYDPCCGTGGMLTEGKNYIHEHINPQAEIHLYGQELNPQTYAIAKTDLLLKDENPHYIKGGSGRHNQDSTLSHDHFHSQNFDYVLANPPYGVDWKKDQVAVLAEAAHGPAGRFPGGTPQINDAQLLFLQHIVAKMRLANQGGSRAAVILNGSPLFTGAAGSGPSQIRRWLLENDLLEAIIALPTNMFYNTGVATYIWILSNRKTDSRRGQVQLIDASSIYHNTPKNLGHKNRELTGADIIKVYHLYTNFTPTKYSKIFKNTDFGYTQITVTHPHGHHTENVPLNQTIEDYFSHEIAPHLPEAHIDRSKDKIGYEIPFNRYFYQYHPPRPLEEIDAELNLVTKQILTLLSR